MTGSASRMRQEILEIPDAVERLLRSGNAPVRACAAALARCDPPFLATVARGSSDHAATYLKYAIELCAGKPVASIGPSIASIFGVSLQLDGSACLSISQSGQSPDIVKLARAAAGAGAVTIALTNHSQSPLAAASQHCLDIRAGPELSVAATKTFVTSVVAGLMLIAEWQEDADLAAAIRALPASLEKAAGIDWPELRATLTGPASLYTLGRGPTLAISNEAALKFKETCQIHAESYSSAEVLHGPVSIVETGFPVLGFAAADAAEDVLVEVIDEIAGKQAAAFVTSDRAGKAIRLDHVRTEHAITDPLALIVSFYAMVEKFATDLGVDPDAPRHLKKVTETI
ncbi:MAG: SIS domain-containing protein [Marinibacterium sp.]